MFEERTYRNWCRAEGLLPSVVSYKESDLFILAAGDVQDEAMGFLIDARNDLEDYIKKDEKFLTTLEPHEPLLNCPLLVKEMASAASLFGVGPMAAVAGAVSDYVGGRLARKRGEIIVENGGDIYACLRRSVVFSLYAGPSSPFTGKIKFSLNLNGGSKGICTSSGTVGHSYSEGLADAVCVVCDTAALADAAATSLCNQVKNKNDVDRVIEIAQSYDLIRAVLIAIEDRLGIWGEIEIIS
jgi:ApbE superfamily uncharacterized protein (UPF0280 family)